MKEWQIKPESCSVWATFLRNPKEVWEKNSIQVTYVFRLNHKKRFGGIKQGHRQGVYQDYTENVKVLNQPTNTYTFTNTHVHTEHKMAKP